MDEKQDNSGDNSGAAGDGRCLGDCPQRALPLSTGGGGEGSAAPVISYATPAHLSQETGYWRQGGFVVISRKMKGTPRYCFKCGAPAESVHKMEVYQNFSLLHSHATVRIPLCMRHTIRLNWFRSCKLLMYVLGCFLIIAGGSMFSSWKSVGLATAIMGIITFPLAIGVGEIANMTVRGKRIDSRFVTVSGAGKEFMEKLSEI